MTKWETQKAELDTFRYTVQYYVDSKIELTNCMQKHFRQLCSRCNEYARCKVYSKYVDAWIRLQSLVSPSCTW